MILGYLTCMEMYGNSLLMYMTVPIRIPQQIHIVGQSLHPGEEGVVIGPRSLALKERPIVIVTSAPIPEQAIQDFE